MAGMTPFMIEAEVSCTDGFCGTVSRVVVIGALGPLPIWWSTTGSC